MKLPKAFAFYQLYILSVTLFKIRQKMESSFVINKKEKKIQNITQNKKMFILCMSIAPAGALVC